MNTWHKITRRIYRYSSDIINNREVRGWCFHRFKKNEPVKLSFYVDEQKLGEATADDLRTDLRAHNVHLTGRCGFQFNIPRSCNIGNYRKLVIKAGSEETPLFSLQVDQIPKIVEGPMPKVLFMHIPKTAGTSFNTFAESYLPKDKAITQVQTENKQKYPLFNASYYYVSGHLSLDALRENFDLNNFDLYTILREPYRHLHSHLNWVKAVVDAPDSGFAHEHPEVVQKMAMQIGTLDLSKPEILSEFVQDLGGFGLDFFDNCQTRYFLDHRPIKVTREHLENALTNLECFTDIGITEQYQAFTQRFCHRIGVAYCEQQAPLNKAKSENLFDLDKPGIRQALLPLVATDLLLYEHVRTRFCNDV